MDDVDATGPTPHPLLARLRRSPIAHGIGANVAGQIAGTFAQLALVPVFVTCWGVATYGAWLLLFTLPSYIVMADLGLASAAGNDMTGRVAQGDRAAATALFQAVRVVGLAAGGTVLCIAAATLYALAPHLLDGIGRAIGGDARPIALALAIYGVIGLQTNVTNQGFRAVGGYAAFGYVAAATTLGEAIGAGLLVATGSRPDMLALWYLSTRLVSMALLSVMLARRAPWLVTMRWQSSVAVLRHLLRPAAAVMILPAALATSIQGTVLVIGAVLGPAAVPAFTAVRTLSRVAVQAVLIVNHAIMPSMTAAYAVGDRERVQRYAATSTIASLGLAVPGAIVLLAGGRWLVALWTHGSLHPGGALLAIMAATMVLNATWTPAANLILAINRHERYTWLFLLTSVVALALCVPLTRALGTAGAALSVLLVDVVMVIRVTSLSRALGLTDWQTAGPMLKGLLR